MSRTKDQEVRMDRGRADAVTRANEAAQEEAGGTREEGEHAVERQAAGARLRSTDSVRRSVEPLSPSESHDTSESAATNRYAKG